MKFRINKYIEQMEKVTYAKPSKQNIEPPRIDCFAGSNPMGASSKAMDALHTINGEMISEYPHSNRLKEIIIQLWEPYCDLSEENIILGEGSIGILTMVNRLFLEKGDSVLGYAPQFSDFGSDIRTYGAKYDVVHLKASENYKFNEALFLEAMDLDHYKLIYIDNPNNPTGQVIDLEAIEKIVEKARTKNACVIVDEAYGDYMANENSAVCLMNRYDNLIVYRSFSKGWGLAGIRAGYGLMCHQLFKYMNNITNPYQLSSISRHIAENTVNDVKFIEKNLKQIHIMKESLMKQWENLIVAETSVETPICLVVHKNRAIDLTKAIAEYGIGVVSGNDFEGLGTNSIRIRLPKKDEMSELMKALEALDQPFVET